MSLARLVVTAVRVEGRSKGAVACEYQVSRRWVHELGRDASSPVEAGKEFIGSISTSVAAVVLFALLGFGVHRWRSRRTAPAPRIRLTFTHPRPHRLDDRA